MKSKMILGVENPHKGLPQKLFDTLVKLVPFVGCELLIFNKKREFLLLWRNDKYWRGWHCPGGLIRFKESFEERIEAVAKTKLGVHVMSSQLVDVSNCIDNPREHVIILVFICRIRGTPKAGKFFSKIPKNTLKHHREYLERVLKKIKKDG